MKKPSDARGPRYRPLYEELRARIGSGELAAGSLLPNEAELCAQHGVSRYTLREALGLLEREGYIQRRRRAGTRILRRATSEVYSHAVSSRSDFLGFLNSTEITFEPSRVVGTDAPLARLLGCDELRQWHLLQGVRVNTNDRRPIGITQIYVDAARVTVPPDGDFRGATVIPWLEDEFGIKPVTVSQDISAVSLTAHEAEVFDERPGDPTLRIIRRYFDTDQQMYLIAVATQRSTDFIYNIRFTISGK